MVAKEEGRDSIPGESPPPPPRVFFGRDELIEEIVGYAERYAPVALIGVGGIGKTSIALTVLHDERLKQRFGGSRRFIRCDQFPASLPHFLRRLSEAVGAGVKNPENLDPLRSFLSSRKIFIVLDNAESVLDPRRASAREIYDVVEELSHFSNICLCITSRISTIPPDCRTVEIPTLTMEPARDTFYRIYQYGERTSLVDDILERLDFHPLSITLLATVAHHNKWGTDRLVKEWEKRRTGVLETEHNKSLAATIELSLASPMFQKLGADARGLLGVVAFFPQGVDEDNLDWFFPAIPSGAAIFDGFCVLSLTYRSNGFVTMLAPLRDYLSPKDPKSSPLLCTTKERYFTRMSVDLDNPNVPGFEDARWITTEDVNVEHLLDVFTSVGADSDDVWKACADFMRHIFWHKKRLIVLRPQIENLPDDHPSKPECVFELSQLFRSLGNHIVNKQLLIHALRLYRQREDRYRIAQMLMFLAYVNQSLSMYGEGILQAKEASEICERFNITSLQGHSFRCLAWLLRDDNQFEAAEAAASQALTTFTTHDQQYGVCQSYNILGVISLCKGEKEQAITHFETALRMASASNWPRELYMNHYSLAKLFFDEERFDEAHTHVESGKSHAVNDPFQLGRGMHLQAKFFHKLRRFEEAKSEVSKAIEVLEKIGATVDLEKCRGLLQDIQKEMNEPAAT
jgi:tetratricopeptide (TPR) repeat protein